MAKCTARAVSDVKLASPCELQRLELGDCVCLDRLIMLYHVFSINLM